MKLADITLGNADGKKESKIESYQSMFYEDEITYGKLIKDKSIFIISGRKGVGKTLLSRYFMDESKKNNKSLCKTISLKDIELTYLKEIGTESLKNEEYSQYLKFCILLEVAKLLVNEKKLAELKFKAKIKYFYYRKKLKKFIRERYPENNFKPERVNRIIDENSSTNINGKVGKVSFGQNVKTTEDIVRTQYYNIEETLEKLVLKCLNYQSVIISTDDIDENNEIGISQENFKEFLLRYILACEDLNEKFLECSYSRCLVIVRDDIINSLNSLSSNFNKTLSDGSIIIDWLETRKNNPWEYKIAKMIFRKIRKSIKECENLTDEEIYYSVFPSDINSCDAFHYLITNSFGRPREIIFWLNTIINLHGDASKFEEHYFYEAMNQYSNHLLGDIKNEMSFCFDSNYIDELFDLLVKMDKKIFKLQNVEFIYNSNKDSLSHIRSIEKALNDLYDYGIIGNKIEHSGKTMTIWSFRPEGKKKFKLNGKFTVHFGLRKALLTM